MLSFSVILNILLFFQMHHLKNNEILYSYDNAFYSTISSNKYNCNIQIVKNDGSTRYVYCDPTIYSAWFKTDLLWSEKSYDLYIFSSDIGLRCIHMDSSGAWDNYLVSYVGNNVLLNSTVSIDSDSTEASAIILKKDRVPEKVLDYLIDINNKNSEIYGSFTSEKTYSFDKKYYALQTVDNDENSETYGGIVVSIYDSRDSLVFSFSPARAWDFWGICWEKDSYNIWIHSGDTGTYCYRYDNDKWLLDESAEKPDYIITKDEAEES